MNVYVSWALFLTVLSGLGWHYAGRPNLLARFRSEKPVQQSSQQPPTASTRKSRARTGRAGGTQTAQREMNAPDQSSSTGTTISKKRKIATPPSTDTANAKSSGSVEVAKKSASVSAAGQDITGNADFARDMAVARAGTQFTAPSKSGMNKKERQGWKPENLRPDYSTESPSLSTGASSTTGADADDDLSPVASPPLATTSTTTSSKSGNVSDMLEATMAGPSILRLTNPTNPVPQASAKQPNKVFKAAETKKQRQQRMKRETHRAQAEEAERERQRLMEKQIRGARMAEGTSAQTRTSAFKAQARNAWLLEPGQPFPESVKATSGGPTSLLDTFEHEPKMTTSVIGEVHTAPAGSVTSRNILSDKTQSTVGTEEGAVNKRKANALAASEEDGEGGAKELSIEEQMRLFKGLEEDTWTTVSKRDRKKTSKLHMSKEHDANETSGESHQANGFAPNSAASSSPAFAGSSNGYHQVEDSGLQDSEWAA